MCMVYIYFFLYKSSLKFDHYYFTTDGSLCLLYSIHSNATITMSMVWLNFDLLLFHKILSSSNQCNQSIIIVLNSLLIVLRERKGSLIGNTNICTCICCTSKIEKRGGILKKKSIDFQNKIAHCWNSSQIQ